MHSTARIIYDVLATTLEKVNYTVKECTVSMIRNTGWEHIYTFLLYPKIGLLLLADTAIPVLLIS
jgi:hypothetical protein